jgi:hypothetical protein
MTTFKDFLKDIHLSDKIEIDFDDWLYELESQSDTL